MLDPGACTLENRSGGGDDVTDFGVHGHPSAEIGGVRDADAVQIDWVQRRRLAVLGHASYMSDDGVAAITDSTRATSAIVRPRGPLVASGLNASRSALLGTSPGVGRMPTTPQKDAGLRNDPPMSLPSAIGTKRAARAAAAPPLEPPADRVTS